jgi:hypothetical protein
LHADRGWCLRPGNQPLRLQAPHARQDLQSR